MDAMVGATSTPPDGDSFFRRSRTRPADAARSPSSSPSTASLGPGTRIAHFVLREFIARGGMGQVWAADDTELRRTVALKLVLPELLDTRALDFFAREARAGGRLAHPNIVTTLASGKHDGLAWIAQELIEGSWTLKDFIESVRAEGKVPDGYYRNVAELVAQIADALEAAHAAGVIHRDIKPANILISSDDRPKLTDFGLARVVDESVLSMTGEVAGSWAYMSPEQIAAQRSEVDHRTDVFSLGVVLYELLTLRRPFDGDTSQQIAEQIARVDPPDPTNVRSQCPRELSVISAKALEKAKGSRYETAAAFAADLRAHLANEPIAARAPGPLARVAKWTRRNPTPAAVTAVSLVALAIVSALLAVNARQAEENAELAAVAAAERDDVLRLAAAQDLDDLIARQRELWPPYPGQIEAFHAWLGSAGELLAELPDHRAKRAELRALAHPSAVVDPGPDPELERLAVLEGRLATRRLALDVVRGVASPPTHTLDRATLPTDVQEWNAIAFSLVSPQRTVFGQEARGVAIAEAALAEVPSDLRSGLLESIAWGCYAIADDDGARAASEAAAAEATASWREVHARLATGMGAKIATRASPEGQAAEEQALAELEAEVQALRTRLAEPRALDFPPEAEASRWWIARLTDLVDDLEALERDLVDSDATTPDHGWSVGRRLRFAERLARGHAPGGEIDRAWQRHLPAIRATWPELALEPQVGLVPLGPDPGSGLHEFAHLATGEAPERDAAESLVLTEASGIVLVLVPEGEFWMGAQADDPAARQFDPAAYDDESPVHRVELSAYFISKYELTQAQWLRATGANPSYHQPPGRLATSLLHPVEQVSWRDAERVLGRLGLTLPTEAQWEHATRAGTDTPWTFGAVREDLRGKLNIADKTAGDDGAHWDDIADWPDHEDGGVVHLEVGSYPPNAFGLHDVHGNVWEWCLDEFDMRFFARSPRRDPVAPTAGQDERTLRGGGFDDAAYHARSSVRAYGARDFAEYNLGVRPARAFDE